MNHKQKILLWLGAANLIMLLLLPPVDSFAFTDVGAREFAGFRFVFALSTNELINGNFLFLEIVVLLVNVAIAWLFLRDDKTVMRRNRWFNFQRATLATVAVNLTLIMMFPPFEYVHSVSRAILPTFQGFYFIFMAGPMLTIVTPLLYLEIIFVLFNGAVLWLLFNRG